MTENEAIDLHIRENLHKISIIEEFLRTNPRADDKECRKNINMLTKANGALQEIQKYRAIGTVEEFSCMKSVQEKIERRVQEIKASMSYPHNYMGQMVDDFEWVLSLMRQTRDLES